MVEKSALMERGQRLQNLRKKTGLTRLAFAEQTGISPNTLKALELGDRELTPQKALLFSNIFANLFALSLGEDVREASFDYLYNGKPKESLEDDNLSSVYTDNRLESDVDFFTTNPAYMLLKVSDGFMLPFYNREDMVAGKKVTNKKKFPLYEGYICILELSNGDKWLRRVMKVSNRKITCCILNTTTSPGASIMEEVEVRSLAQVLWHWRLSELV